MRDRDELQLPDELQQVLDEAVQRIVEIAHPQAIILFGSYAEGRAREQSDVDLMVVADAASPSTLAGQLLIAVEDLACGRWDAVPPFEVVVLTPAEWNHEASLPGLLVWRARRHGVILHGQAA